MTTTIEVAPVTDPGARITATKVWVFYGSNYETASIAEHGVNGSGVVGPAKWLDEASVRKEIMSWKEREQENTAPAYLPHRILSSSSTRLVWFVPAAKQSLAFTSPKLEPLSGKPLPVPPLVFSAGAGSLTVFALARDDCPGPATRLYEAPFPNTYTDGSVCLGSMPRHGVAPPDAEAWTDSFFESAFTHETFVKYWRAAAAGKKTPKLKPAGITLKDLIYGK